MVGILELLSKSDNPGVPGAEKNQPDDGAPTRTAGRKYKMKHANTMGAQEQQDIKKGVGSFGVSAKLKDISKKIKKKAMETTRNENMDAEQEHLQKLEYFQSLQDSLPELREELKNETSIFRRKELADQIRSIELREEENDYLFKTMHIIKKMWGEGQDTSSDTDTITNASIELVSETKESAMKRKLTMMYMKAIDPSGTMPEVEEAHTESVENKCRSCESEELEYDDGELFCTQCGLSQNTRDMNHVSFKESASKNIVTNPTYKRINHFNEWLNSVTNKSTSMVPESIIDAVKLEMTKDNVTDPVELDKRRVRLYLKRLGQSKYYDSVSSIICKISGQASLDLPHELISQLRDMFVEIQEPFERSKPKNRSSFLSYSYTINRMLKLLAYDEYMYAFPLLKSREKLLVQDMIWKGICEQLNWRYDPTV